MKNLDQELLEYLQWSAYYMMKYSEKQGIPLPHKDEMIRIFERADSLINEIKPSTDDQHGEDPPKTQQSHKITDTITTAAPIPAKRYTLFTFETITN